MAADLPIEEDFLDPAFGKKYIGYPAVALVCLALVLWPISLQHAVGVVLMAAGYAIVGVGFLTTVLYHRRFHNERTRNHT